MQNAFNEIFEYVKELIIIDSMSTCHTGGCQEKDTDVIIEYLAHYFNRDLISAGLSTEDFQRVMDPDMPIMEKWDIVEPFWNYSRYTGYGRSLDISAKALYNIDMISRDTIEELNDSFKVPGAGAL